MLMNIGNGVMDKKAPSLISGAYSLMEDSCVNTTLSISLSSTQQNPTKIMINAKMIRGHLNDI